MTTCSHMGALDVDIESEARRRAEAGADLVPVVRERLRQRFRTEFIAGAEEDSRRRLGRPLTHDELVRVLRRYPGAL
jgi:hypothetical protein